MLLEGLHLPLTTPFYPDGRLNLRKLEHNVAAYSKSPVSAIAVLSRHGEPTMLSDEETRQTLQIAIEAAASEKVMLAGISRDSVHETLAIADHAAALAYDAALVAPPSFLQAVAAARQAKELLTYFQAVADRAALPIVLDATGASLPIEIVIELAGHPRILGLVDGKLTSERVAELKRVTAAIKRDVTVTPVFAAVTGRMLAPQQAASTLSTGGGAALTVLSATPGIKTRIKGVGFQILAGNTVTMLDALLAGAVGAMPAFAACAPQATYEVIAAWKDGDRGLAEEKQQRLQAAAKYIEEEVGTAAIKFGCDLNGYFGGLPRLPLLPPSGEDRTQIESLLQGLRN
ncbi:MULTISPECIES: dihydrodipicolinate synthase family protein [Acidobacteriaceae]|uniref:dihydrodipicolinate synthase family protein n=1 Tax=Acidobacteriaceae TaxID=204434 RepID=UPI00131CE0B7|nr:MULTISPECIES: dihydrodipicolinate synthase family protein [Acidobacteriaceae]MDW5266660.1 dihydrodipicolinate synthase family protein [Edaphobacter sp.]